MTAMLRPRTAVLALLVAGLPGVMAVQAAAPDDSSTSTYDARPKPHITDVPPSGS